MKKIIFGLLALTFSACSSIRVLSDYDRNAEFKNYKTFEMAPPQENLPIDPVINQLNGQRVQAAIINELEARGYRLVEDANLVVNIYVKVKKLREPTTTYEGSYFPYRIGYWYYGYWGYYNDWGLGWGNTLDYKEGTLVVDLVDSNTKKLVWHGLAIGDPDRFRKNAEERINAAIEKMFFEFQFKAGNGTPSIVKR